MQPEIDLFGLNLKTFGMLFALAFISIGLVAGRRLKELGKPVDWAYEVAFAALVGGVIGSRGYFLIENWDEVKDDLIGNIFSGSGLVWYGGVIGGAIAVAIWGRYRGVWGFTLLDLAPTPLALGYAIGRIGCQISGDGDYGKPADVPWAMAYPHGEVPTTAEVHPTPIYETLWMGLVAWFLWQLRDQLRPGALFAVWMVLAGVERIVIEFWRRNPESALGLTTPQLQSIGLAIVGIAWLAFLARRHGGLRRPDGGQATAGAGRRAAAAQA